MSEWKPIESAPKDGKPFLMCNAGGVFVGHYCGRYQSGYVPENPWHSSMLNHWHLPRETRHTAPTHWMELPEPPK